MSEIIYWDELSHEMQDALIAEKVMGLGVHRFPPMHGDLYDISEHAVLINNDDDIIGTVPHYTTSMDAAWTIVEKIKESADAIKCSFDTYLYDEPLWAITTERICITALKAMGFEVRAKIDDYVMHIAKVEVNRA
jgi:Phage ABA sandwich domain